MRKAFTLIEVMVVLSILAIIAILAYNFFGSTMKEARVNSLATQIHKDLITISTAWEKYILDNGTYPTSPLRSDDGFGGELTALRTPPVPPAEAEYTGCAGVFRYFALGPSTNFGATAAGDAYVGLECVSEDVCRAYNKLYQPKLGNTVPENPADIAWPFAGDDVPRSWCHYHTAGDNRFVDMIMELN